VGSNLLKASLNLGKSNGESQILIYILNNRSSAVILLFATISLSIYNGFKESSYILDFHSSISSEPSWLLSSNLNNPSTSGAENPIPPIHAFIAL
jgi:hypothetical protein